MSESIGVLPGTVCEDCGQIPFDCTCEDRCPHCAAFFDAAKAAIEPMLPPKHMREDVHASCAVVRQLLIVAYMEGVKAPEEVRAHASHIEVKSELLDMGKAGRAH